MSGWFQKESAANQRRARRASSTSLGVRETPAPPASALPDLLPPKARFLFYRRFRTMTGFTSPTNSATPQAASKEAEPNTLLILLRRVIRDKECWHAALILQVNSKRSRLLDSSPTIYGQSRRFTDPPYRVGGCTKRPSRIHRYGLLCLGRREVR